MLLNTVLRRKKFTRQLTGCLLTVEDSDMVDSVQVIQEQRHCSILADSSHSDCHQSYSDSSAQSQTPRQLIQYLFWQLIGRVKLQHVQLPKSYLCTSESLSHIYVIFTSKWGSSDTYWEHIIHQALRKDNKDRTRWVRTVPCLTVHIRSDVL